MTVPGPGQTVHLLTWWNVITTRWKINGRNAAELALHTTDDLRRAYRDQKGDLIRLTDGLVPRLELVAEIRWCNLWSRLGAWVTLAVAIVAAMASLAAVWLSYLALYYPPTR